jgi:hypothetical protein
MENNGENSNAKEKAEPSPPSDGTEYEFDANLTGEEFLDKVRERFRAGDSPINNSSTDSVQTGKGKSNKALLIGITILILLGLGLGLYKYLENRNTSQLKQAEEKQAISSMVAKYNAFTEWRAELDNLEDPYTLDIEKVLIREDKRPLLLSVNVGDIKSKDGKVYVNLNEFGSPTPEIQFLLECDSSQVEKMKDRGLDEFAVVASIKSVSKPQSANEDPDTFWAQGQCIDLLPVHY